MRQPWPSQLEDHMHRFLTIGLTAAALALTAPPATAQGPRHTPGMIHSPGLDMSAAKPAALPREGGQSAFAAVGEISNMLQADPATDWSKVDIDALRGHLLDMDNVMMRARVTTTAVAGGARFDIAGDSDAVRQSIRRMVASHSAMTDGDDGRHEVSAPTADGAALTVTAPGDAGEARIRALGFFGLLTGGAHHQQHHLMMAKGEMHHG
jgi:hypothetical protein